MDLLFANQLFSNNDEPGDDTIIGTILGCQETVGILVEEFNHSLTNGTLTLEELQAAHTAIESSLWDSYKLCWYDRQQTASSKKKKTTEAPYRNSSQYHRMIETVLLPLLPSVGRITNEIHELKQLKQTLKPFTCAFIRGKSYSLDDFDFQSLSRGGVFDLTEKFCTSALQKQLESIQSVIGTDPDFLYWYAYFKIHTSILLPSESVNPDEEDQSFNVNELCKQIKEAFGPNMSYSGVGTAMQLFSNANDCKAEMKVLLNCQILKITAIDVTNFSAVKILHEISKPLQDFIRCCELHQFKVVDDDPSFRVLQTMVQEFYSTESHDRQSCFDFFDQLYRILRINEDDDYPVGSYSRLLHGVSIMKSIIKVMVPMKYLLDGENMKFFLLEMKWLSVDDRNDGAEGLKKFNEDYSALLSYFPHQDTAYELLIADSLKQVVQIFSFLKRYSDIPTVHDLVLSLMKYSERQILDIYDLNDRIPAIKDLFQIVCQPVTYNDEDNK